MENETHTDVGTNFFRNIINNFDLLKTAYGCEELSSEAIDKDVTFFFKQIENRDALIEFLTSQILIMIQKGVELEFKLKDLKDATKSEDDNEQQDDTKEYADDVEQGSETEDINSLISKATNENNNESLSSTLNTLPESQETQVVSKYNAGSEWTLDSNTGCYISADGYYFDASSGSYYIYDVESSSYVFHSQVSKEQHILKTEDETEQHSTVSPSTTSNHITKSAASSVSSTSECEKRKSVKKKKIKKKLSKNDSSPSEIWIEAMSDDGHPYYYQEDTCITTWHRPQTLNAKVITIQQYNESKSSEEAVNTIMKLWDEGFPAIQNYETETESVVSCESSSDIAPCLRLMVLSGSGEGEGELHVVTIDGGGIGRDKSNAVKLNHESVSKHHAHIRYQSCVSGDHQYIVTDLGSTNGTFVKGQSVIEVAKQPNGVQLGHGWKLFCGEVSLSVHLHPGNLTCNECEPGLVASKSNARKKKKGGGASKSKKGLENERRCQVKALRKKYDLGYHQEEHCKGEREEGLKGERGEYKYKDRAEKRRQSKGSDNPYEKTQMTDTNMSMDSSNVGFQLLQQMGWKEGEALGASQKGILKPVMAGGNLGTCGLGSTLESFPVIKLTTKQMKKQKMSESTRHRMKILEKRESGESKCESDVNEGDNKDGIKVEAKPSYMQFVSGGFIGGDTTSSGDNVDRMSDCDVTLQSFENCGLNNSMDEGIIGKDNKDTTSQIGNDIKNNALPPTKNEVTETLGDTEQPSLQVGLITPPDLTSLVLSSSNHKK